jgi:transcriptional regulator with XRE-family HTH domain
MRYLMRYRTGMESPAEAVRRLRLSAGFSQRELARRAETSQPAVARYESGAATPSWETLQRLGAACGRRLTIQAAIEPDPHDVEAADRQLALTPLERLHGLRNWALLSGSPREKD